VLLTLEWRANVCYGGAWQRVWVVVVSKGYRHTAREHLYTMLPTVALTLKRGANISNACARQRMWVVVVA
jgi:hypothetical protein